MIERAVVSNVYGDKVITPLSESEYQSIKWDWQIMVEEIEAEASSISQFAESIYMMQSMSLTSTDEDFDVAKKKYDERIAQANKLFDKADKIRNANRQGRKEN